MTHTEEPTKKRTARDVQREKTLYMRAGRAAQLLGYASGTLHEWCRQGWLQADLVPVGGVKQFRSKVIYQIRDRDRIWRIATGIKEGRLDVEEQVHLAIARRTASEHLQNQPPVTLIQLAELLYVTPGTIYTWKSKMFLPRHATFTSEDFTELCAYVGRA